ncbi:MAG TPA: DinB family protein [Longimicrobiaceae bacterium]|nr:DinB family protein [Longimicrobiaceae bacterium]
MPIADLLVPELENELAITRRVLERVPDGPGQGEWKPHEKSFPMGHLAQLVARLPGWAPMMMDRTELDISPVDGPKFPGYSFETTETLLAEFDRNAAAAKAALAAARDEDFGVPWTLKKAGEVVMTMPRYQMLRFMVLNHLVHHRAQLGIYLRLVGLPVPMMYGPTADEGKG